MKKVVLALLVVLTAASVSFAGYTPTGNLVADQINNGNVDFETYIVGLQVDDTGGIISISDITVTGTDGVVQVWSQLGTDPVEETPGPLDPATNKFVFDTRILDIGAYSTNPADPVLVNGSWTETNDATNPITLDPDYGGYLVYTTGYGDIGPTDPSGETNVSVKNPMGDLDQMDFLQVCIPAGSQGTVTGLYTNAIRADAGLPMIPFSFAVGAPEPSTIIMLVMGALCLVGYRLRRK